MSDAYARGLHGDHAAWVDVVQEATLVVVKKFDQFQEGTSMLAWCRSIVRLEVLRLKQRHQPERTLAERLVSRIDAAGGITKAKYVEWLSWEKYTKVG